MVVLMFFSFTHFYIKCPWSITQITPNLVLKTVVSVKSELFSCSQLSSLLDFSIAHLIIAMCIIMSLKNIFAVNKIVGFIQFSVLLSCSISDSSV